MKQDLHSLLRMCCAVVLLSTFSLTTCLGQSLSAESSSFIEGGFVLGPSNFLGDLGGNAGKGTKFLKDNNIQMTKLTFGVFVAYHPNDYVAVRFGLNRGILEGDDNIIKPKGGLEEARRNRNTDFRSRFFEGVLVAEVYPTVFLEYDPTDVYRKFRPYVLAGIGAFKYNPQGTDPLTGEWVNLQPLRTEGQGFAEYPTRKEYKLVGMNLPIGLGVKYYLSENTNLSFELMHRKTFTDYIDDVSTNYVDPALFYNYMPVEQAQLAERMANKSNGIYGEGMKRGTPNNNDSYYTAQFKLGFRLGGGSNRFRNATSCPVRF